MLQREKIQDLFGFCFDRLPLVWQVVWCFVLSKKCSCQNSQTATRVADGRRLQPFLVGFLTNLNLSSMLSCFKVSVNTSDWSSTLRLKELTVSAILLANLCFLCLVFGVKGADIVALYVRFWKDQKCILSQKFIGKGK